MTAPYTFIVRFDIAPLWIADGFILSDQIAKDMLAASLPYACEDSELAAQVLGAPNPARIEDEQGYRPGAIAKSILAASPEAYKDFGENSVLGAVIDAIELIDSVAFVRNENDNSREVLQKLHTALEKLNGNYPISDIEWQEAEA
ncbi:hypothetical protein IYQ62_003029 [Salmonella enterica]|uniref:hypothetical protein n=1 Tax=Enterobacter roggenkampii TaxID=1812935 RepID=UPI0018A9FD1D|nr:hypothetical protein [Enterobacter roggenkampii]EGP2852964.1 hypothetical protein [Salmonella enterica]